METLAKLFIVVVLFLFMDTILGPLPTKHEAVGLGIFLGLVFLVGLLIAAIDKARSRDRGEWR